MIATDLGSPPLSSSIAVFIAVANVQDELPRFVNIPYSGVAVEGAASVGTSVLQVRIHFAISDIYNDNCSGYSS